MTYVVNIVSGLVDSPYDTLMNNGVNNMVEEQIKKKGINKSDIEQITYEEDFLQSLKDDIEDEKRRDICS